MKLNHKAHEGHSSLSEINIIPLVDVILVLLIIFMVAAPLMKQGVDIDLPEVDASAVSGNENDFTLSIDGNNRIFLGTDNKTYYSLQTLEDKLKAVYENKEKKEIYVSADKDVPYGYVIEVMALCQKAGIQRVGMLTYPEKNSEKK